MKILRKRLGKVLGMTRFRAVLLVRPKNICASVCRQRKSKDKKKWRTLSKFLFLYCNLSCNVT